MRLCGSVAKNIFEIHVDLSPQSCNPASMFIISICLFLSGFAALVYELLWMRHLGLIFGNTVYAAATVTSVFMGGLAVGSYFSGRLANKIKNGILAFSIINIILAVVAVCMPFAFDFLREIYKSAFRNVSESMLVLTSIRLVFASLILLVPTALMGATLPLLASSIFS